MLRFSISAYFLLGKVNLVGNWDGHKNKLHKVLTYQNLLYYAISKKEKCLFWKIIINCYNILPDLSHCNLSSRNF